MKLFYSPNYNGFVYTGINEKNCIQFDEKVVNTKGLLEYIKLHAGIKTQEISEAERFSVYLDLVSEYAKKNPNSKIAESFNDDKLNVTSSLLQWRDLLSAAGWSEKTSVPSSRFEILKELEPNFKLKSFPEEVIHITNLIRDKKIKIPETLEIVTPFDWKLFKPYERNLLKVIGEEKIKILSPVERVSNNLSKITDFFENNAELELSEKDDSFEIWTFNDRNDSYQFLSSLPEDDFDLWVNTNNKVFDNWLSMESKPLSGSDITTGFPQISQLTIVGLSTLLRPLNINNLVEWLSTPLSPLDYVFRKALSKIITDKNGYYNEECKLLITEKDKEFHDQINAYLPALDSLNQKEISKNSLLSLIKGLKGWAKKERHNKINEIVKEQLATVINHCELVELVYSKTSSDAFSNINIENLISLLYKQISYPMYEAQIGCRSVVFSSGAIASKCKKTILCDFYDDKPSKLTYSFLSKKEYEVFSQELDLWAESDERSYRKNNSLLPFKFTSDKLVLVVVEKNGISLTSKNTDYIKIENACKHDNGNLLDDLLIRRKIQESDYLSGYTYQPEIIDNRSPSESGTIFFKNTGLLKWRETESYSSLDDLVQNPLDYAFEKFADIKPLDLAGMSDVSTTYGTVAHEVIQNIFEPKDNVEGSGTIEFIKKNLDEKIEDETLSVIQAHGSILLLQENALATETFKNQLRKSIYKLIQLMEDNNLHVFACEEKMYLEDMGFSPKIAIKGYADMILEDAKGQLYLFDFKWTRSKSKHKKLLEEAKSIQLVLYKYLMEKIYHKEVVAVGYYTMPAMKFYTLDSINGDTEKLTVIDERVGADVLREIQNAYKYRREQISSGCLENADGLSPDQIKYSSDTTDKGLLPLSFIENKKTKVEEKKGNLYSNYKLFKEVK